MNEEEESGGCWKICMIVTIGLTDYSEILFLVYLRNDVCNK